MGERLDLRLYHLYVYIFSRPVSYEKRKVQESAKKTLPPVPYPNIKVVNTLREMFDLSFTVSQFLL